MKDSYGREINYLRLSVTDACNLRCAYCMPERGVRFLHEDELLSFEEIIRIANIMATLGINCAKVTGGEPLMRPGVVGLIRDLKAVMGVDRVTLTTNGVMLADRYEELVQTGLDSITVSLDTLDRARYMYMTGCDALDKVLKGIEAVKKSGLLLKLNCVLTGREEDVRSIASYAKDKPIAVRFIEMMPLGGRMCEDKKYEGKKCTCTCSELKAREVIERSFGPLIPFKGDCKDVLCGSGISGGEAAIPWLGNGPARYFSLDGFKGKIGFISAVSHRFCDSCNRIRLTSDGFLKGCLQFSQGCDLRGMLRSGCSDREIREACAEVIRNKPERHRFFDNVNSEDNIRDNKRTMSQIGG